MGRGLWEDFLAFGARGDWEWIFELYADVARIQWDKEKDCYEKGKIEKIDSWEQFNNPEILKLDQNRVIKTQA